MTHKANILVVDDEEAILELIQAALARLGYRVTCAHDGNDGVKKIKAEKFDLAIMDIMMPGMDGITALGEMKKIDPEIEVIMATGHGTMSTAVQSMRKGAFDYLHKPFQPSQLIAVVERALEKRKFNDITKAIFSTIKPDELPRIIIDSAMRILKADEAFLALAGRDGRLGIEVSDGLDTPEQKAARLDLCARLASRFEADGAKAMALLENLSEDKALAGVKGIEEIKSAILLPLLEDNKLTGLIAINRRKEEEYFNENDLQRAKIFGSLVNLALRNANLYRQLQETQSQLIQAEKMSALGQLAGGLAHEINNPLSGILGLTQLVLENSDPAGQNFKDLKDIEKAVFRCKRIITSLLSFARQEKFHAEPINVNEALEETLTLCARQMELKHIRIVRDFGEALPPARADFQQLMQVFLNLLTNAKDSIPESGAITITTRPAHMGNGRDAVAVSIADTGAGIPQELLNRIFDPFFTTKPVGKGTGLGLSVCLGIVNRHSGTITAKSEPGKGSVFTLELPV
ncbi:MAG: hypothetical protein A2016_03800 [Elusimicrobia bacterium GWF2_62_30]|nr:MAG: hypothetical protein A2016_03800 [Elusimicrobia bacterium GWF2_62_30]